MQHIETYTTYNGTKVVLLSTKERELALVQHDVAVAIERDGSVTVELLGTHAEPHKVRQEAVALAQSLI